MDSIYILLLTLLLHIFFGTIVDAFMATKVSTGLLHIKTKVFFHTFLAPIIFALLILFVVLTDNKGFNIFFGVGLITGSLIRAFFGERKYVTNFNLSNSHLEIEYLTSLLRTKNFGLDLKDIASIEMDKTKWLSDFPATIKIGSKNEWTKFYLVDKNSKSAIQNDIDSVNNIIVAV